MTQAETYIENLQRLARRERSYLAAFAYSEPAAGLTPQFRDALQAVTGVQAPENAFVSMEYPISQLYAAGVLTTSGAYGPFTAAGGIAEGNQEDVDFVVAWAEEETAHVVLVEALGITGWGGKRLLSKAHRLGDALGYNAASLRLPFLQPHFAIAAPSQPPADLVTLEWPDWMTDSDGRPAWLKLAVPTRLLKVTRTMPDGTPRASGGHWIAEPS